MYLKVISMIITWNLEGLIIESMNETDRKGWVGSSTLWTYYGPSPKAHCMEILFHF